ncbi:MAG: sulfurtransferase [Rhodobacterales bacterium]|nr:MAG: sulfurtransferase [Rhodobacterales bacterium]
MFNMFNRGPQMPADEIVAKAKSGDLIVIDIRDPSEIRMSGKAKGALEIPMATFPMKIDPRSPEHRKELTPDTPIALYCASGARSGMAARAMQQMGYKEVYNLGSLREWHMGGGEIDA